MLKTQNNKLAFFLFALLFLCYTTGSAQETQTATLPLKEQLKKLENTYAIKFSFVDSAISNIKTNLISTGSLQEQLENIAEQTNLSIQKINDRYYAITLKKTITICGTILDNFKNKPLASATIQVINNTKSTIANSNGEFTISNIPRDALLQIKFLGYKTKFITAKELIKKETCTKIVMAQKYQELNEVIVYKFLTTGLSKNSNGSISINTADFGILPGQIEPDILKTIQALPGIKSIDETVSDINIRGGTNDQNLILWDGIKMYQSGHFFGLISAFNPYLTDKITSIKNGSSAQYGDGVSGVLDIKTKDNITSTIKGGAGLNFITGDAYARIPITNKIGFQFSARRSLTDFLDTPTYTRFSEKAFQDSNVSKENTTAENKRDAIFYFYDFTGKLLYDMNAKHKVRFNAMRTSNTLDYVESRNDSLQSTSNLDQTNFSFGGTLSSSWSPYFSTNLTGYYTQYTLNATNINNNNSQNLEQRNEVLETALKWNTTYQPNANFIWKNGYHLNEVGITNFTFVTQPPFNSNIKGVIRTHALFSEVTYNTEEEKFYVQAGARLNFIENLDTFKETILEPRLAVSYKVSDVFKLETKGEFKNQSTNQIIDLEQNFLGIEKRRWILSDGEQLPITKSKQASFGIHYDRNNLYIGLDGFFKEVKGISTATQGFQNQYQFNGEIGQYAVKGVEFLINKKSIFYSVWLSYAYNTNTYTFKTLNPQNFPNNLDIRHTATIAGTYSYKKLKIGLGLNYRSGKPYTQPQEGDNAINTTFFPSRINYQEPNSSRLPEYIRADGSVTYSFKLTPKIKAIAGAAILNFTGRKNILNTYYRVNQSNEIETIQNLSIGATPNASFRINF
ncbi:outer membrane receptor for ferrienterochelin and colicin [Maribacter vaceletii]|uniref:Outer membrane receptor for ferrienterochelin and colicin n=1 Tax=Maribacter vaceletii TaxID=1206816 RepID=A0A495E6B4_9FLAO|nr:TonB-dependent receptor [Maribacter vaceletii]RKR12478.1 outer membrane receptor for ferrienterochelin and colicin [Maribacter vaceletii]